MIDFIETPRFPVNISEGSSGGPEFKTFIFEGSQGNEQATVAWSKAKAKYDVGYGIRDTEDMDIVRQFFYECRGKAVGFRYKDWADFKLTDELIATGDGVTTVFKLVKTYGATNPYVRRIFKPINGTFSVTVGGAPVTEGAGVTVDYSIGKVTFGVAPADGAEIRATCEFDVPVRFDIDQMNASFEGYQSETWGSIPLVEKRIKDFDEA